MRIIAGIAKGRRLKTLKGHAVRPTSDKTRGAIFNILGSAIVDASVLDLFTGTGALGIEALSRGAGNVTFIDNDTRCARENLESCDFSGNVISGSVSRVIKKLEKNSFNIVFADPPYGMDLARNLLSQLNECGILKNFSLVVIEHSKRDKIEEPPLWKKAKEKRYGDTIISLYEYNRNLPGHI